MYLPLSLSENFHYSPLAVIAANLNGIIIYKNPITTNVFPKIRCGSNLRRYTDASLDSNGFKKVDFLGQKEIVFVNEYTEYDFSCVLFIVFPCLDTSENAIESDKSTDTVLEKIINSSFCFNNDTRRRSGFKNIENGWDNARLIGFFLSMFTNKELFSKDNFSIQTALNSICAAANMKFDKSFHLAESKDIKCANACVDPGAFAALIVSCMWFASCMTDKNSIDLTFLPLEETGKITLSFNVSASQAKMLSINRNSIGQFLSVCTMATCGKLCEKDNINIDIATTDTTCTIDVEVPAKQTTELIFQSDDIFWDTAQKFIDFINSLQY